MSSLAALLWTTTLVVGLEAGSHDPSPTASHLTAPVDGKARTAASAEAPKSLLATVPWSCVGSGALAAATGVCVGSGCGLSPCGCGILSLPLLVLIYGAAYVLSALNTVGLGTAGACLAGLGLCAVVEAVPPASVLGGGLLSAKLRQMDAGKLFVRALPGIGLAVLPFALFGFTEVALVLFAVTNQSTLYTVVKTAAYPVLGASALVGLLLSGPAIFVGINARDE